MPLYDFREFLTLSSVLNYNLSASTINRYNILTFIIGEKRLDAEEKKDREQKGIIMEALNYLFSVYRQKRRRLGPMAVLHPLRATALFNRSQGELNLVNTLSALFHDVLEDVNSSDFENHQWRELEEQLYHLLRRLHPDKEDQLITHLLFLTKLQGETYYRYIGRLLENSQNAPEVVQIKMADRLDNTLDMRIDLQDPLGDIDFFQTLFQILFVNNYPGFQPKNDYPPAGALNGARRLYQLFKNAVILSLIRQKVIIADKFTSQTLFDALADASLKEAQRTLIHLLGYHYKDLAGQRKLLLEAMEYCFTGRSDLVTKPDGTRILDGLFTSYFGRSLKKNRNQALDALYQDKPLMIEASVAFIVIFLSFLNQPDYFVKGISAEGISPRDEP